MHALLAPAIAWLEGLANSVPLEVFVLVGGIVEEIIAPIPSPIITTLAGSLAAAQGYTWPMLFVLNGIACITKTMGACVFYVVGDKLEDAVVPRYGKYLGVTHAEVEQFGKRFGKGKKDAILLMLLRSIPMMPSLPVSLACGIVRLPFRTFLVTTYVGFYLRELFFIILGYTGIAAAGGLLKGINSLEGVMNVALALGVFALVGWLYWRRRKGSLMSLIKW